MIHIIEKSKIEFPCGVCNLTVRIDGDQRVLCCGVFYWQTLELHSEPEYEYVRKRTEIQAMIDEGNRKAAEAHR